MTHVDTAKAKRRMLRFETLEEMLAEAERITRAERAGKLKRLGNWSPGQAFGHLARWSDFAYEGYPPGARPPAVIRFMLRFMKKKFLNQGLPAGVRIPKVEGGTYGVERLTIDDGLDRLRRAVERLKKERAKFPSPAFGEMSREEQVALNLRHAELHLGFFEPE